MGGNKGDFYDLFMRGASKGWQRIENDPWKYLGLSFDPGIASAYGIKDVVETWGEAEADVKREKEQEEADKRKAEEDAAAARAELARHNAAIEEQNQQYAQMMGEYYNLQSDMLAMQYDAYMREQERLAKAKAESEAQEQAYTENLRRRLASGAAERKSTMMTGGTGATSPAPTKRKTLLGE